MTGTPRPGEVAALVEQIRPLLAGKPAEVQGAALADLLAIFLAGHHVAGNEDATRRLRSELLANHCTAVRALVEVNAKILGHDTMNDPAPPPWKWDGTTLTDANGKLVCVLAARFREEREFIAALLETREMLRLLIDTESHLSTALPDGLLLDEIREVLDRIGGKL